MKKIGGLDNHFKNILQVYIFDMKVPMAIVKFSSNIFISVRCFEKVVLLTRNWSPNVRQVSDIAMSEVY